MALVRFRLESEPDLGWHLAQGRLLAHGLWLRTNALSWTARDAPWVDTSWLFDLITFLSTRIAPALLGPKLVVAALLAAALLFLGLACDARAPLAVWLLPALTLLLLPRATPRPHVAAWAALACVLHLCLSASHLDQHSSLASHASARRLRLLALLPLWLGAQLHAGAAFAAAPLGLFSLEAFLRTRARRALWPLPLSLLALLAGPAGPASLIHLLRHWDLGQVVQIEEFQPWRFSSEPLLPVILLFALLGLFLDWRQPRDSSAPAQPDATEPPASRWLPGRPALLASVLLFALLALRTQRLFYELVIVAAPALALLVSALRKRRGARTAALAMLLLFSLALAPHALAAELLAPRFDPGWNEQALPVRAARFLEEHAITGPGFNGLRDGGYLAWARPGQPIFLDARIHAYPAALWKQLESAEQSPAAFDAFLRDEGAQWALTTRQRERLGGYRLLDDQPGWALVYWDEVSAVYLRRDQPQLAAAIASLEFHQFHPWGNLFAALPKLDAQARAALDAELARYLDTSPHDALALIARCASALQARRPQAASACDAAEDAAREAQDSPARPALAQSAREIVRATNHLARADAAQTFNTC